MISVVICTYNRVRMFEETVRSFLNCRSDGIEHEMLLVDNNSTDETRKVAERYTALFPRLRFVCEPLQGLSNARNLGIRESRGDIVAFLDDDVFFSPSWLAALASTFERHPDVACVGGKVVAHFEAERPSWLEDDLLDVYSISRYGDQEKKLRYPEFPIGCNMAYRRSVFERIGGFPTSLGRRPGNLLSNDEIYFWLAVEKANLKTLYSPDAEVAHRISPERTTRQWLLRRWYWQGISDVAMMQVGDDPLSRGRLTKRAIKVLLGFPRQWRAVAGFLGGIREENHTVPIRGQINFWYELGKLRQLIAEALASPEKPKGTR